jgi:hypothetical protein
MNPERFCRTSAALLGAVFGAGTIGAAADEFPDHNTLARGL